MQVITDPTVFLESKARSAQERLKDDSPLIALSCRKGTYIASYIRYPGHEKFIKLVEEPEAVVVLASRGNQTELSILQDFVRRAATGFANQVSAKDLAGRLLAPTVAEILRSYHETPEVLKTLAVQVVVADPLDREYPFWAISFDGEMSRGRNFFLCPDGIQPLDLSFSTFDAMKNHAMTVLEKKDPRWRLQEFSFERYHREKNKKRKQPR